MLFKKPVRGLLDRNRRIFTMVNDPGNIYLCVREHACRTKKTQWEKTPAGGLCERCFIARPMIAV